MALTIATSDDAADQPAVTAHFRQLHRPLMAEIAESDRPVTLPGGTWIHVLGSSDADCACFTAYNNLDDHIGPPVVVDDPVMRVSPSRLHSSSDLRVP